MMHGAAARAAIISQLALVAIGCAPVQNSVPDTTGSGAASGATGLTAEQRAAGWRPLFDGTSTSAWRGLQVAVVPHRVEHRQWRPHQVRGGRGHHDEGPVREFPARARLEALSGGQCRNFLSRHRGVRQDLLERPRVPAPRRRRASGWREPADVQRCRLRSLSARRRES